jgi:hypothetical protein
MLEYPGNSITWFSQRKKKTSTTKTSKVDLDAAKSSCSIGNQTHRAKHGKITQPRKEQTHKMGTIFWTTQQAKLDMIAKLGKAY